jgi:putative ABC transport system substrate-binding protein
MQRRKFLALLGGATAMSVWPFAARAQQAGRTYRLAIVAQSNRATPQFAAFFDEMRLHGFVEGQNLEIVPGGFNVPIERLPEHAAAMMGAAPDVIFTVGDLATRAALEATRALPIVAGSEDMIAAGFVTSLARPGGNITGVSLLSPELDGKRQDILIEAVPGVRRMAALADSSQFNATTPRHHQALRDAAAARGVELSVVSVGKPEQIAPAISEAKAAGAQALNVLASPMFGANRHTIVVLVSAARLPAVYQWPDMAEMGGLAAYGPPLPEIYRQRARMVVKVLRGTKPADIPVEQPTRFELVINLKTAKAIGHEIPAGLVLRADKLIE